MVPRTSTLSRGLDATASVGPRAGLPLTFSVADGQRVLRELGHDESWALVQHFAAVCGFTGGAGGRRAAAQNFTCQYAWSACELSALQHNRNVNAYLERRMHRQWRSRGS
jgi:hypothetical protein